ncbi:MAG: hypothetical protein WB626_02895 [Bacteroidota bacterium]
MFWKDKQKDTPKDPPKDTPKDNQGGKPMDKKARAEMYSAYLRNEGFSPTIGEKGEVLFKMEGRTYVIFSDENDEPFFQIVFPNFWTIESEQERAKVERAALHATAATKVAKIYPVESNVWGSIEMFLTPPDSFKAVFHRSMGALTAAVNNFAQEMRT